LLSVVLAYLHDFNQPFMPQISFEYVSPPGYVPKYVNGAFGGVSPKNEIVINFYLEAIKLPSEETYELDEKAGSLKLSESTPPELVRNVQTGVILDVDTAKNVLTWLTEKIKVAEERAAAESKGKGK
jgi:hypothetical protein